MTYDLSLELIEKKIKETKAKKVLIQLPAGLRVHALEIARIINKNNAEAIIWAGTCYGACDLPECKEDLLIHFGHQKML